MENPRCGRCDFCMADNLPLHCIGDYWVCMECRQKLEDEIEALSILMEEE